ncbi:hypothetical protein LNQ81_04395 [Myroides sp. M-43]|uniref:DUF7716 domain-containing protein n=1 Tax=Myroides oncorhynchi TaxID=2893756 RepID=UPI001E575075|nr:hypothetical protein [Myroides oncorhynchi]MCC9041942.1 hypothetical protein [Myroides oncorhynchi]
MMDFKNKTYQLAEFILLVKDRKERTTEYNPAFHYAIYAVEDEVDEDLAIYVGEPVEVTDNDEEIYPSEVIEQEMWYLCSDEDIQDVVDLAISQKPSATMEELVMALDYYLTIDDFIDLIDE